MEDLNKQVSWLDLEEESLCVSFPPQGTKGKKAFNYSNKQEHQKRDVSDIRVTNMMALPFLFPKHNLTM